LILEIKIGDKVKIPVDGKFHPEAGHYGKCVWISDDGKTAAISCERSHEGKITTFMLKTNSKK